MLADKQNELMNDLLFTVHQHGGDDVTWKPPIRRQPPEMGVGFWSLRNAVEEAEKTLLKQDYGGDPVIEEDIDEMSDELLAQIALKLLFRIHNLMTKMVQ